MQLSQKLALCGVSTIFLTLGLGFVGFTHILKFGIKDQISLRNRNEVKQIYLKLPFPIDFAVKFFNVTNPDDVQIGAKPILKEVGPYVYDEWPEKINVVDNDADDSLTYTGMATFKFNEAKSAPLHQDDYVSIIHPLIVGMVNTVAKDQPALLSIVNKAIGSIFQDPKSIYLTAKVRDLLFDGVEINCQVKDFSAKAVCTQLKAQIPGIKTGSDKNIFLFSLFGPRNATGGDTVRVLKGIKRSRDVGRVLEVNHKKVGDLWSTPECNQFKGTDGWIFPPLLEKGESIWTYSPDLCRNVEAYYVNDTVVKGVNVRYFSADLGDQEHNEKDKCYCGDQCLPKGLYDLSKCMGVPIIATLPHFLYADDRYLSKVEGLQPDPTKHNIFIYLEPLTSTPLQAKKRMQLNFFVKPIPKINLMRNLSEMLHPILWLEEGVDLEGPLLMKIKGIFIMVKVVNIGRWFGLLFGLVILGASGYFYYKNKKDISVSAMHVKVEKAKNDILNSTIKQNFPANEKNTLDSREATINRINNNNNINDSDNISKNNFE